MVTCFSTPSNKLPIKKPTNTSSNTPTTMLRPQLKTSRSYTPEGPAPEFSLYMVDNMENVPAPTPPRTAVDPATGLDIRSLRIAENVDDIRPPAPTSPSAVPNPVSFVNPNAAPTAIPHPAPRAVPRYIPWDGCPPAPRAGPYRLPRDRCPPAPKPPGANSAAALRGFLRDPKTVENVENVPPPAPTPPSAVLTAAPRALPTPVPGNTSPEVPDNGLHRFLVDETFADITLIYGSHSTRAHKIILCSQSQWFAEALETNPSLPTLPLPPLCWTWALRALLSHLYTRSYTPTYRALLAHTSPSRPAMAPPEWHAHVYLHALRFGVPTLIAATLTNFRAACAQILARARAARIRGAEEVGVGGVVRAVGVVYQQTRRRGVGGGKEEARGDQMRKVCVEVLREGFVRLSREGAFGELVAGDAELRRDLGEAFRGDGVEMVVQRVRGAGGFRMG
ncbi:uncharacterized protein BDZ99DRAFT_576148 [Mytilinidion resinicola]|uniref:BTB domain-containing protein n=1 Tax=Mytilinidion resinicola TaxID=574789 RepID=A0A6A6Y320_9PEZI|nr:uncharacterized protein BDZ99DRAFT_576148 [Mytilinidion resinicola]KAF2803226.1 hypothetical protein BDZ99DRAFT_576148 [Mytilinidion resinicola]